MEHIDVIDEEGNVLYAAPRVTIYKEKLLHNIAHVFIYDENGRMLLQKRGRSVSYYPNTWCTAAAGHIQAGESPQQGASRELHEELGVAVPIKHLGTHHYQKDGPPKKLCVFTCICEGPFSLSEHEVEDIAWFTPEALKEIPPQEMHPELAFLLTIYAP